jgi:hypothetical protein
MSSGDLVVITVEARTGCLALADADETVRIDSLHSATDGFFEHLGIARQVSIVNEIFVVVPPTVFATGLPSPS